MNNLLALFNVCMNNPNLSPRANWRFTLCNILNLTFQGIMKRIEKVRRSLMTSIPSLFLVCADICNIWLMKKSAIGISIHNKMQSVCNFHDISSIYGKPSGRGEKDISEYVRHLWVVSYFSIDIGCQSQIKLILNFFRLGQIFLIFQVLLLDQPVRPENRKSTQP